MEPVVLESVRSPVVKAAPSSRSLRARPTRGKSTPEARLVGSISQTDTRAICRGSLVYPMPKVSSRVPRVR